MHEKKYVRGAHPENPFQKARINAGLSQERAAEALDCGTRSIQGYEAGRNDPPISMLKKMMKLYGCEFSDLYPDEVDGGKPPPER